VLQQTLTDRNEKPTQLG